MNGDFPVEMALVLRLTRLARHFSEPANVEVSCSHFELQRPVSRQGVMTRRAAMTDITWQGCLRARQLPAIHPECLAKVPDFTNYAGSLLMAMAVNADYKN